MVSIFARCSSKFIVSKASSSSESALSSAASSKKSPPLNWGALAYKPVPRPGVEFDGYPVLQSKVSAHSVHLKKNVSIPVAKVISF